MSKVPFLRNTTVELADGLRSAISSVPRYVFRGVIAAGVTTWVAAFIRKSDCAVRVRVLLTDRVADLASMTDQRHGVRALLS